MDPYPYLDTTKIQSGNELFHHYRIMETSISLKTPLDIKVQSTPNELFHHYRIMETSSSLKTQNPLDIKVQSPQSVSQQLH
jgi:hypothetical protein